MLKLTVIHGQHHKGSTYHITNQIVENISNENKEVYEYFLPKDGPNYCIGCYKCFNESDKLCPQAEKVQRIVESMKKSHIIIIDSPTYCYGMTGQLKTLFDHFGYMWLSHRPKGAMFNKVGIVVSTAAGAGGNKVTKDLKQQMFWLGISNVLKYSKNLNASNWETVPAKTKKSIEKDVNNIAIKVRNKIGNTKSSLKLKFMFMIMRIAQKSNDWNITDRNYWQKNGWLDKKRPW